MGDFLGVGNVAVELGPDGGLLQVSDAVTGADGAPEPRAVASLGAEVICHAGREAQAVGHCPGA